jgi:hypothetical protein
MGTGTICSNLSISTTTSNHGSTDARVPLDSALLVQALDVDCGLPEQRKKRVARIKIRWIIITAVATKLTRW